jgi:hypothetical protein
MATANDLMHPPMSLLVKLGSIAVHAEELIGPTGHQFDKAALDQLLRDPEVTEWREAMDKMAFLPKKRTLEDVKLAAAAKARDRETERQKRDAKPRNRKRGK